MSETSDLYARMEHVRQQMRFASVRQRGIDESIEAARIRYWRMKWDRNFVRVSEVVPLAVRPGFYARTIIAPTSFTCAYCSCMRRDETKRCEGCGATETVPE